MLADKGHNNTIPSSVLHLPKHQAATHLLVGEVDVLVGAGGHDVELGGEDVNALWVGGGGGSPPRWAGSGGGNAQWVGASGVRVLT